MSRRRGFEGAQRQAVFRGVDDARRVAAPAKRGIEIVSSIRASQFPRGCAGIPAPDEI